MTSYVITASIYVDNVNSPEEATALVDQVNHDYCLGDAPLEYGDSPVQIRLPDSANEPDSQDSHWEEV